MPCVICGSAVTVRSHIIPRSLFRMSLRAGRPVVGSRRSGSGYQYLQSGFWDEDILCAEDEAKLCLPDDYAARFCRKFVAASADGSFSATIPNPKPGMLVTFAGACVWRMAASRTHGRPEAARTLRGPPARHVVRGPVIRSDVTRLAERVRAGEGGVAARGASSSLPGERH